MVDVRSRLKKALTRSSTLPALREELVLLACDLEEEQIPTVRNPITDASGLNRAPDTERDSAPATLADSELGKEYGV